MKRFTSAILALAFAMGIPMISAAMSHEDHGKAMADDKKQHGGMAMEHGKAMDHGMSSQGDDFVEIGKDTQQGVVATVKVKAYDEATRATMTKMGMDATHHVMVFFTDENSGKELAGGMVAIKVQGQEAKPVMMMLMGSGFGGDVSLQGGMATFEIGTKLEDDQKRQFSVMFHNM